MLTVIVHQEDAKRYRSPVTYYNEQLMPLCGFSSAGRLIRARERAVKAGWLHYQPGSKGKPGIYWVTIPADCESIPDTPMDEDLHFQNRNANEKKTEGIRRESVVQTEGIRSANGNLPTLVPNSLDPNPKEENSASAEFSAEASETPAPPRQPDDPTEFVFECVGKGAKTWTLPKSKLLEYLEAYPDLDVRAEIRKSRQWIRAHPTRRKTANGMLKFLTGWLNRAQNSGGRPSGQQSTEQRQLSELAKAIKRTEQEIRDAEGSGPPLRGLP